MFDFFDMLKEQTQKMGLAPAEFDKLAEETELPDMEVLSQSLLEHQERMGKYLDMTPEALAGLPDEDLFEAAFTRLAEKDELNYIQQVFNVVSEYDMEMQNGGLCQYFINTAAQNAGMLEEALEAIGAEQHKAYFHDFLSANGIDVNDLSDFELDYLDDNAGMADQYERMFALYPFDAYDEGFYQLPELYAAMVGYVRENIAQF